MSERDADIDEIMRHAISAALDCHNRDKLDVAVRGIRKALERAGYVIRRSDEEQEPYGLMPVYRASDR